MIKRKTIIEKIIENIVDAFTLTAIVYTCLVIALVSMDSITKFNGILMLISIIVWIIIYNMIIIVKEF